MNKSYVFFALMVAMSAGCGDSGKSASKKAGKKDSPNSVLGKQTSYEPAKIEATCIDISGGYDVLENGKSLGKVVLEQTGCESIRQMSEDGTTDVTMKIGKTCFDVTYSGAVVSTCIDLRIDDQSVRTVATGFGRKPDGESIQIPALISEITRLQSGDLKEIFEQDGKKAERTLKRLN